MSWSRRGLLAGALSLPVAARAALPEKPAITFVVNVHDTGHVDESADTVIRLAGVLASARVRGDFYVTAPMAELYAAKRPDAVAAIQAHTVSYHARAPHPLQPGFDGGLRKLDDAALAAALADHETYALDPTTGTLDRTRAGGFRRVAEVFGTTPVAVGMPSADARIRAAAARNYARLGAKVVVWYHESGTPPDDPFQRHHGLLARPSDFSVTRIEKDFWWNQLSNGVRPLAALQEKLGTWRGSRPPFVTSLIHENNPLRRGPESWTHRYYADDAKRQPLPPPWPEGAPDTSKLRPQKEREGIFRAWEEMVRWAAGNIAVVTSEDLVGMAPGESP